MKTKNQIPLSVLLLLLGTFALPASADKGDHDKNNGGGKEKGGHAPQQKQARAEQPQGRPEKQARSEQHADRPQHQARPEKHARNEHQERDQKSHDWQKQRGWEKGGAWHGNNSWKGGRAKHWESDHRNWHDRGGYGGYYIPQDNYRLYFGHDHWFRIQTRPVIYMGYPRFVYGGHSFLMVDPYPETWDENWYQSDDVYIDYDDGYYLHSRRDPGIAVSVSVVL